MPRVPRTRKTSDCGHAGRLRLSVNSQVKMHWLFGAVPLGHSICAGQTVPCLRAWRGSYGRGTPWFPRRPQQGTAPSARPGDLRRPDLEDAPGHQACAAAFHALTCSHSTDGEVPASRYAEALAGFGASVRWLTSRLAGCSWPTTLAPPRARYRPGRSSWRTPWRVTWSCVRKSREHQVVSQAGVAADRRGTSHL
jgi:hypothetical protein